MHRYWTYGCALIIGVTFTLFAWVIMPGERERVESYTLAELERYVEMAHPSEETLWAIYEMNRRVAVMRAHEQRRGRAEVVFRVGLRGQREGTARP